MIRDIVVATLAAYNETPKPADCYKATEARLYAYPTLLSNITQYQLDIQDLKKERITEKSKDITCWGGVSSRLTPEEKQQARIMSVEIKLERDKAEVSRIDRVLHRLETSSEGIPAADFIRCVYMRGMDLDTIARQEDVSLSTVQRRRTRLVRQLALMLYGAEALQ
ncbi:MAG: hypothetical protein SPI35_07990 [Porphyromonas sp.]|nr:hypothetical protein [Porphyromonas sp.]